MARWRSPSRPCRPRSPTCSRGRWICSKYVISGGSFHQFETQVLGPLHLGAVRATRLHLMPTSGTPYYRYETAASAWVQQYAEDLSDTGKSRAVVALKQAAEELGLWEQKPNVELTPDRRRVIVRPLQRNRGTRPP